MVFFNKEQYKWFFLFCLFCFGFFFIAKTTITPWSLFITPGICLHAYVHMQLS